jgi:hypothetical protein
MEYKYEVTWDSSYPIEDGEGVHRYTQDFFDIAEARQCLIMMRGRNAIMKVIPVGYE